MPKYVIYIIKIHCYIHCFNFRFKIRSVNPVYVNTSYSYIFHAWEFDICITFVYGIKMVSGAHFYLSKYVYVLMELYIFFMYMCIIFYTNM